MIFKLTKIVCQISIAFWLLYVPLGNIHDFILRNVIGKNKIEKSWKFRREIISIWQMEMEMKWKKEQLTKSIKTYLTDWIGFYSEVADDVAIVVVVGTVEWSFFSSRLESLRTSERPIFPFSDLQNSWPSVMST